MSIQDQVKNFIDQDVSIRRGLSRGYISLRKLAKYIYQKLQLSGSPDAVISAIRRYNVEEQNENIKQRYLVLAGAKITSRSQMCSLLLGKNQRKAIMECYDSIDFSQGHVVRILEVSANIKLIVDQQTLAHVKEKLQPKSVINQLGEISIQYQNQPLPGVFAAVASELALHDIVIKDALLCGNEHVIFVDENQLVSALQALDNVRTWALKT